MADLLLALAVGCSLTGIVVWIVRVAFIAEVRNDLYRCREQVFDLIISGKASLDEEPVKELVEFIHNMIVISQDMSFSALLGSVKTSGLKSPSFLEDERLKPIALKACQAGMRGLFHSSILLKALVFLCVTLVAIYRPLRPIWDKFSSESKSMVCELAK